jgi:hypothetical protein
MKRALNLILGIVFFTGTMAAQDMFVSSGAEGKSTKGTLTWVVGGGISVNQNDASPVLTPEVYEKQKIALSLNDNFSSVEVSTYPNPVTEFVNIQMKNDQMRGGKVIITDVRSKCFIGSFGIRDNKFACFLTSFGNIYCKHH